MLSFFIDFLVALIFIYTARLCWKVSKRKQKKQSKLLFKTIAIFIMVHLVIFPIIYLIIVNGDASSIKIEKNISEYERNLKLERAITQERKIEKDLVLRGQPQLEGFLNKYSDTLSQVAWDSIEDIRILKIDSFSLVGYSEPGVPPGGGFYKNLNIYNSKGYRLNKFITNSNKEYMDGIIIDYLNSIKSDKNDIQEEIKSIKNNRFWSYRQILPYTLNILFTDNFTPQSKTANILYFLHNILVVGFLLSIIINLFQYYLLNKE